LRGSEAHLREGKYQPNAPHLSSLSPSEEKQQGEQRRDTRFGRQYDVPV
jgi:hypothetical protein